MRIYLSSTFSDLAAYRAACIRVLRQLGHDVVSMEDYVAESSVPVAKVVADVKSCNLYVVLVAWRYGYVPRAERVSVDVPNASKGTTSITHYEYLAAVDGKVRRLAFLLHERAPWSPHLMDGFGRSPDGIEDLSQVLAFREQLQQDQMVAFFESPADLEARLSAAVASVGLRSQMLANSAMPHAGLEGIAAAIPISDSGRMPLENLIAATPSPEVATIDIATTWWSTRLYLLATVSDLLTSIRRIVVMEKNDFVGIASTTHIRRMLSVLHPEIDRFERERAPLPLPTSSPDEALSELLRRWRDLLQEGEHETLKERTIQRTVTRASLARWLGDGLLTGAIRVVDLEETTILELLRVLDYPNDFVPMVEESVAPSPQPLRIVNKATLNAQLAQTYIDDLLKSVGLRVRG